MPLEPKSEVWKKLDNLFERVEGHKLQSHKTKTRLNLRLDIIKYESMLNKLPKLEDLALKLTSLKVTDKSADGLLEQIRNVAGIEKKIILLKADLLQFEDNIVKKDDALSALREKAKYIETILSIIKRYSKTPDLFS